jgi:small subunit ribosomal protein S6
MKAYELMLMLDPSLDDEAVAGVKEKAQGVVTDAGGAIDEVDDWGKKKLAFEVDDRTEGIYSVMQLHAAPDSIAELDRVLRITDPVLRHMIVRRHDID